MKKLNAKLAIQNTDRITIYNTGDRIEFYYNNSNRREGVPAFTRFRSPFRSRSTLTNAKTVAARQEVICYER